jgi:hypothetical protein
MSDTTDPTTGAPAASADARFWALWDAYYPPGPLPPDPRERDLTIFCAGALSGLVAFLGDEAGRPLGDALAAGAFLREVLTERMEGGE